MNQPRPARLDSPTPDRSRFGLALVGALWFAAGCSDAPTAPATGASNPAFASEAEIMFNPQPDPYAEIFRFLIDNPNLSGGDWRGSYLGRGPEAQFGVVIENLPAPERQGEALHLSQRWSFDTADGPLPPVRLDGVLNLRSGRLALNGHRADGGTVHVRGWLSTTGGGSSIAGEVMFNPQPDPPMPQR
jgi:hypothetical protein